jgi:internalin A
MSNPPKAQLNFNAPVYGVAGNVEGDQIIHAASPDLNPALAEILQILSQLQQQHPTATAAEATDIIEAEFKQIKTQKPQQWQTLRRQLLNRERWFNGGKAALTETTKHFVEGNVFYKAGIAFLEGFSADEDKGE